MTKDEILSLIDAVALRQGIPASLLRAQVEQESCFDPQAISECGAVGLLQLEPSTARDLGLHVIPWNSGWSAKAYLSLARDAGDDRLDPFLNLAAGATYLRSQYDHFPEILELEERWKFALASYNAGRGHVNQAIEVAKQIKANYQNWSVVQIYLTGCDVIQVRNYVTRIWEGYKGIEKKQDLR